MKVDKHLFQALVQFWNSSYSCFIFGKIDLKLMNITGMNK
ncbi:hypothetical protein Godav_029989 [Gossypium davidsonii]|uniref:Uncharacterized protein n=1 Tax=Gossypium davidsonii TaxID=34287 RepID=A0A7J8TAV9_GOSDV|nr:hypothetical protein [Gossypium davidsonii]